MCYFCDTKCYPIQPETARRDFHSYLKVNCSIQDFQDGKVYVIFVVISSFNDRIHIYFFILAPGIKRKMSCRLKYVPITLSVKDAGNPDPRNSAGAGGQECFLAASRTMFQGAQSYGSLPQHPSNGTSGSEKIWH